MENYIEFGAIVILISASGVLLPGPLFAANIFYGIKGGTKAGLKMAFGHTVIELPLVVLLGIGVFSLEAFPQFREIITIVGAIGLFAFAGMQIRIVFKNKTDMDFENKHNPFFAGILLSGLNPFFIIWWLTIGFKLISDAIALWSFVGILIMFIFHIWMDFAWLSSTAFLSSKFSKLISTRNFKFLIVGLSIVLIYFGIMFLVEEFVYPQSTISI